MSEEYEATTVVAEFGNEAEALAAQGALQAAGIEAHLTNDNATFMTLFGRLQFSPIRLAVATSRIGAAMRILGKFGEPLEKGWEEVAEGAIDGWLCPACDSVTAHAKLACAGCGGTRPEPSEGYEVVEEDDRRAEDSEDYEVVEEDE